MSIWSQLEQDSKRELELLNRAMNILYRLQLSADDTTQRDIDSLECEVTAFYKNDHRGRRGCVAFDISEMKQ